MILFLWTISILAILMLVYGFAGNFFLKKEYYQITNKKLTEDKKIILLTDLHGCQHGKDNEKLVAKINEENPNFICISGDMTVKNGKNTERILKLLKVLANDYPIYYAPGNHEIRMPAYEEYKEELKKMGVRYLENQSVEVAEDLQIIGLDLGEYWYHKCWQKRNFTSEEMNQMVGVCEEEKFQLLLAHNPEYFPQYTKWGADLTLSGHLHGGIAILPILGGVISPSLRLFPKYDAGAFSKNGKHMIISRGLGLHHIKLRFFNVPEISVIQLTATRDEEKCSCQFTKK